MLEIKKDHAIVLYTCDIHCTWDSARVAGVFTEVPRLLNAIAKLHGQGEVSYGEGVESIFEICDMIREPRELQNHVSYIMTREITLNTLE